MTLSLDDIDVTTPSLSTPDITQLTTNSLAGTGVFDALMRVTKLHLLEEYTNNRITGKEYSTVYLGAMTAAMQQSIAFLTSHQQQEKVLAEIGLIRQQTVTELTQTDNDIPVGLGFNGDTTVEGIVASQLAINNQQELLLAEQTAQVTQETELIEQKTVTELAQTDNDIPVGLGHNNSQIIEGIVKSTQDKLAAETDFTIQKSVTEVAQVNDTLPAGIGLNDSTTISGIVETQKIKTESEVQLLNQKSVTELAQTDDTIPSGTGISTNTAVTGTIGKQKDLFTAQTDGFARDAEQKTAKMLLETWSVRRTTDEATLADNLNKLDDASIGAVVTKLKEGIDVT